MNRERGFTLVEMLVSVAILTIALSVLFSAISSSLDRTRQASDEALAASLVQSLLARTEAQPNVRVGETDGTYSNGFHWNVAVSTYGNADDAKAWGLIAYRIRTRVSWHGGTRSLSALRLVPPEKPP